jgi:hypothetical protein
VKSLDAQRINDAQKKLDWAIQSLDLSIKCMVLNYKDQKYKVQFFTWENKVIRGVGFKIPERWIEDTNPRNNDIHDELESLLKELEQEARREMRELNGGVSKKSETD